MQKQRKRKPKTNEQTKKEANKQRHKQTDTNKQSTNQTYKHQANKHTGNQANKMHEQCPGRQLGWAFLMQTQRAPPKRFCHTVGVQNTLLALFFFLSGCLYLLLHLFLPVVRTFFLSLRRRRRPATVTARTTTTTPPTTATTTAMRRTTTACRRRTTTATTTATDVLECPQDLASCQLL
jgi:hypothetical protein